MDWETQLLCDEDHEQSMRLKLLELMTHMGAAFSYVTQKQENMRSAIAIAQRNCVYEKGMLSRTFHAPTHRQVRVELALYPESYARLATDLAGLMNRVVDSKPGTDYTSFLPEIEQKMQVIGLHMDFIKNRLDILGGRETERKFNLN
jgi:hypothetical protein